MPKCVWSLEDDLSDSLHLLPCWKQAFSFAVKTPGKKLQVSLSLELLQVSLSLELPATLLWFPPSILTQENRLLCKFWKCKLWSLTSELQALYSLSHLLIPHVKHFNVIGALMKHSGLYMHQLVLKTFLDRKHPYLFRKLKLKMPQVIRTCVLSSLYPVMFLPTRVEGIPE